MRQANSEQLFLGKRSNKKNARFLIKNYENILTGLRPYEQGYCY